jgi:hypothetical protein
MHFLTSLITLAGFAIVIPVSLVKLAGDLSQVGIHEAPSIPESIGKLASPSPAGLGDALSRTRLIDNDVESCGKWNPQSISGSRRSATYLPCDR